MIFIQKSRDSPNLCSFSCRFQLHSSMLYNSPTKFYTIRTSCVLIPSTFLGSLPCRQDTIAVPYRFAFGNRKGFGGICSGFSANASDITVLYSPHSISTAKTKSIFCTLTRQSSAVLPPIPQLCQCHFLLDIFRLSWETVQYSLPHLLSSCGA